jgi:hypothetical protein
MPRAKSPTTGRTKKDKNGVAIPVVPDANPVAGETLAGGSNHEAEANTKAQAAAAGAAQGTGSVISSPAVSAADTRKFEVHKSETRRNIVPINIEDEIRRRAYEIFLQRGQGPGGEADDWFAAEREVMQRYRQQRA